VEDYPTSTAAHDRALDPDTVRDYRCRHEVHERRTQTADQPVYARSRLKLVGLREGAALYASLPAVSGKTRSPVRAPLVRFPASHAPASRTHPRASCRAVVRRAVLSIQPNRDLMRSGGASLDHFVGPQQNLWG
jgi:hypothetical protein